MKNFTTLIKESFEIYKQKIKSILMILIIGWVLTMIFGILMSLISPESIIEKGGYDTALLVLGICLFIISFSALMTFSFIILAIKPVGIKLKEIFQDAWKKLWQYFLVITLVIFFNSLASIFLIIPGMIVGVYLSFSPYIFIMEGEKGMNALKRSWSLVKGNWWQVFGRLILLNIFFGITFIFLDSLNNLLASLFQFLFIPFMIIFTYLIYLELKKSKEIQAPTPIQI